MEEGEKNELIDTIQRERNLMEFYHKKEREKRK
jgi:hypothetical protein